MFVGIKIQYIYGTSGNELPPPVIRTTRTGHLIHVDTIEDAMDYMQDMVLPLRKEAVKVCEPYSWSDGYDWDVVRIVSNNQ